MGFPLDQESSKLLDQIEQFSEAFDNLCQNRHNDGVAEYGEFTFLENDVVRMMAEELADTANYCRMQFIKLMMLNEALAKQLEDNPEAQKKVAMGKEAFKGTKKGWGNNG